MDAHYVLRVPIVIVPEAFNHEFAILFVKDSTSQKCNYEQNLSTNVRVCLTFEDVLSSLFSSLVD